MLILKDPTLFHMSESQGHRGSPGLEESPVKGKIRYWLSYLSLADPKDWCGARPALVQMSYLLNGGLPVLSTTVLTATQDKGSNLVGSYPQWTGPGIGSPESHTETQNMESGPKDMSSHPSLILVMPRPPAGPEHKSCGDRDAP